MVCLMLCSFSSHFHPTVRIVFYGPPNPNEQMYPKVTLKLDKGHITVGDNRHNILFITKTSFVEATFTKKLRPLHLKIRDYTASSEKEGISFCTQLFQRFRWPRRPTVITNRVAGRWSVNARVYLSLQPLPL